MQFQRSCFDSVQENANIKGFVQEGIEVISHSYIF